MGIFISHNLALGRGAYSWIKEIHSCIQSYNYCHLESSNSKKGKFSEFLKEKYDLKSNIFWKLRSYEIKRHVAYGDDWEMPPLKKRSGYKTETHSFLLQGTHFWILIQSVELKDKFL